MPIEPELSSTELARKLQVSESRFHNLVDNSPDSVVVVSQDGRVCFVNRAAESLFGRKQSKLVGHPLGFPLVVGESTEVDILQSNGQTIVAEMRVVATEWEDQPAILASLRDTSQHQQLLNELKTRTRLAELTSAVNQALTDAGDIQSLLQRCAEALVEFIDAAFARIWTISQDGTMLELQASAGLYKHLDGPHGRVPVGKFKIGLIAEERKPHLTNKVVGDPRVGDQEWAQREGMVAFAGYPLIVDGEMTGVMGVFAKHELSADTLETLRSASNALAVGIRQKKTETVLRNAEQRLRATIEAAPAAMVMVDQTGQIVLVNAETEQLFGYVRDELLGQSVEMLVPPRFRKDHSDHRTSFFDKPAARPMGEGRELTGVSKDGVEFPVEIGLNPVHTDEGLFVLSAILDITERTQLTESLRQSNVELVVCQ